MRRIALMLGLSAMAWATPTLSQPRKIAGIHARTVVSDGQFGYVDDGSKVYRLQRTEEGIQKLDSVGYEGNRSEAALYIPRDQTRGFLVFKDSVCSVDWRAIKDDRMMCTGGVSLGWGDYSGGITLGKLNVCGGTGGYEFDITTSARPTMTDSLVAPQGSLVTCEVHNPDLIDVRLIRGNAVQVDRCFTVGDCTDMRTLSNPTRPYDRNRVASNGGFTVSMDSLGRIGDWVSGPVVNPAGSPIAGYVPGPRQTAYLAAATVGSSPLAAIGFDSTLVFGRRVDLGLEEYSRIRFESRVGIVDMDNSALWLQVGADIVSFDLSESISSLSEPSTVGAKRVLRAGRTLEIAGVGESDDLRILRPDGSLEARIPSSGSPVRWTAPAAGWRIVQMGRIRQVVLIP